MKKGFVGLIVLLIGGLIFVLLAVYVLQKVTFVHIPSVTGGKEQSVQEVKEQIQNVDSDLQKKQKEQLEGL